MEEKFQRYINDETLSANKANQQVLPEHRGLFAPDNSLTWAWAKPLMTAVNRIAENFITPLDQQVTD